MENNGWIKLHRRIMDKGYYKKSDYKSVWFHLLLKANHKDNEFWFNGKNILVKEGQFITGRKQLSLELGISESKIERILKFFEKTEQQIEQQKTNKNRLITMIRWKKYQGSEQQNEQQVNNKRTTSEQQVDTNKNVKKIENDKNVKNLKEIYKEKFSFFKDKAFFQAFQDYLDMRKENRWKTTDKAIELILKDLHSDKYNIKTAIEALEQSTMNSYRKIFPLKSSKLQQSNYPKIDKQPNKYDNIKETVL